MYDKIYHKQREKTRDSLLPVKEQKKISFQNTQKTYKSDKSTSKRQANRQMIQTNTRGK